MKSTIVLSNSDGLWQDSAQVSYLGEEQRGVKLSVVNNVRKFGSRLRTGEGSRKWKRNGDR